MLEMLRVGALGAALALVIIFDSYVRPSTLWKARVEELLEPVAPEGLNSWALILSPQERSNVTKTGTVDDTVVCNHLHLGLSPWLEWLKRRGALGDPLLQLTEKQLKAHIDDAAAVARLSSWQLMAYQPRQLRVSSAHGRRRLRLTDSMCCALASTKGRRSDHKLLNHCRQRAAYTIACNITARWRWIPSEPNIADSPSRLYMSPFHMEQEARINRLRLAAARRRALGERSDHVRDGYLR